MPRKKRAVWPANPWYINTPINQRQMNQLIFTLSKWLLIPVMAILVGCAQKPPSCADEKTIASIKDVIVNAMGGDKATKSLLPNEDPQNIVEKAIKGLKVDLKNVVTQGYDEKARKHACRGNMVVTQVTGDTLSLDINYASQATEDKGGGFMVEIQGISQFLMQLGGDLKLYYFKKRYAGEWAGTYSCAGINDATEGLQGPFSRPVVLVVDKNTLMGTMERTTQGGGIESLKSVGIVGVTTKLAGTGRNGSDDTWVTQFNGQVSGMQFNATGNISVEGNRVIRNCRLKLDLPSNP